MRQFWNRIRSSEDDRPFSKKLLVTLAILFLGIVLGLVSKWLDELSIDETIWWMHFLGAIDLGNILSEIPIWFCLAILISVNSKSALRAALHTFLFFLGMTASYHWYTVFICGFNPLKYMMIWYTVTFVTPLLAFLCWYAKGKGKFSFLLNVGVFAFALTQTFYMGLWYFGWKGPFNFILLLVILFCYHQNWRRTGLCILFSLLPFVLWSLRYYWIS